MNKPPDAIDLRVRVSPALYAKIGDYRHTARHDSKNQALVTLLAAGLAALAKPPSLPKDNGSEPDPSPKPARSKPIPYAGAYDGRAHRQ
jgi:hypothetical protein